MATQWQQKNMPQQSIRRVKSKVARSRVTNGKRLFLRVPGDNRTAYARRARDILDQLFVDLGGFDHLSEAQIQLARRAAIISIRCEEMEGDSVAGEKVDWEIYGKLTDRLGRVLQRLGIKRVPRNVTPNVSEYIEHINAADT